jgi:hypothetical protein
VGRGRGNEPTGTPVVVGVGMGIGDEPTPTPVAVGVGMGIGEEPTVSCGLLLGAGVGAAPWKA